MQVKELFALHEDTKNSQIKGKKAVDSLADIFKLLSEKFDKLEKHCKKKDKKISVLERKVELLESKLGDSLHELEQYFHRNCLLLHGVQELEDENMDDIIMKTVKEEMDIDIWKEDVDRKHRIDNSSKPRPIIIKFACYDVRSTVYKNKKKLKGKNVLVTESLKVVSATFLLVCF